MKRKIRLLFCLAAVVAAGFTSYAQFYTIAPGGSSGYATDTIYTPSGPPPTAGGGAAIYLPGPPPPIVVAGTVIDGLSFGSDWGNFYHFSVTFGAAGLPLSPVAFQATVGTAPSQVFPGPPVGSLPPENAGDIFAVAGLPMFGTPKPSPPAVPVGFVDEFTLGLNVGPAADDLNSLSLRPYVGLGYYSLSAAGVLPAPPAAIMNTVGVWAAPGALHLDSAGASTDDIDALLVEDLGTVGLYEPGVDFVAFSLTPGSATLGLLGYAPGTGGGDLFVPGAGPLPTLFIPGAAFGLTPTDNLDAIDAVPEPSVVSLILAGLGLLGLRCWRDGHTA